MPNLTFPVTDIDWQELDLQKRKLVEVIWDDHKCILWGLVSLIDSLQDHAVDVCGMPSHLVFPSLTEEPINAKQKDGSESASEALQSASK